MVCEIDLQGCDGDMTLFGGMKIGAFAIVHGLASIAYPVHGFTARTQLCDDRFCRMSAAQTAQGGRLEISRFVGNVDIEQPRCFANELRLFKLRHHVFGKFGCLV